MNPRPLVAWALVLPGCMGGSDTDVSTPVSSYNVNFQAEESTDRLTVRSAEGLRDWSYLALETTVPTVYVVAKAAVNSGNAQAKLRPADTLVNLEAPSDPIQAGEFLSFCGRNSADMGPQALSDVRIGLEDSGSHRDLGEFRFASLAACL